MAPKTPKLGPPAPDELEISVFGPGVGECVVLHVGSGAWIVVDSCVDPVTREPAALVYLRDIGVDPAKIQYIVMTHWHDDHVAGAARLLEQCPTATVACSAALRSEEFLTLVAASRRAMTTSSGVDEFRKIVELLRARKAARARPASVGPELASADKRLWRGGGAPAGPAAELWSLSPSSGAMHLALQEFGQMLPTRAAKAKRNIVAQPPNHVAVVLWVEIGEHRILLGADLENTANPVTGWNAILSSTARPPGQAQVFKVAHHGSENGDRPEIWTTLLAPAPVAVVTPFRAGKKLLPTADDVQRLKASAGRVFCTAPTRPVRPPKRDTMVDRIANSVAKERRVLLGKSIGHVCIRTKLGPATAPSIVMRGRAYQA